MPEEQRISNKQLQLISHLLSSPTVEQACKKAKIGRVTYYTWLKDEVFKQELKRQRDEVVKGAIDRLKIAMTKAVNGLIELMDTKRPDLRRWVYKDIIDYTLKSIELEDIEERLDKLEQIISERRNYK